MANDAQTGLLVSIEARTAAFEKALLRIEKKSAQGFAAVKASADKNIAAVEKTLARANQFERRMSAIDRGFIGFGKSLIPSLGAITAALSVREVAAYADAWTSAKNSLAVAGITGRDQAKILDQLYDSAQRNAAPLGAMADLFGKAAQASDNLGASNADLVSFADGVGVALRVAGTSATAASGSLTQLGQLLGQTRVSAEEFNSVGEGARPILIAVAAGLDKAGGSVSKLKKLVNDGEVSGRQFFEAFLKGLPKIQAMAANSTQSIEAGVQKISNAFMRYIGQTDESLGASQRLVAGLNALADDFDSTADLALQLASVLAGALVGRSIAGMISAIPQAASAMMALVAAMRAGTLTAAGFGAALGPLGLIAGAAVAATYAFGNWGDSIDDATRALADQAASGAQIEGMIADVAAAQKAYQDAIAKTAGVQTQASASIVADTLKEFNAKKSLLELELKRQQALIAVQRASLSEKAAALKSEVASNVFTDPSARFRGYGDRDRNFVRLPDDLTGLDKTREVIANSPLTSEIQKIRAEMELAEIGAGKLEEALNSTFSSSEGGGGVKPGGGDTGGGTKKKGSGSRLDEYQRLTARIAEATAATMAETEALAALNPTVQDYGLAAEKARTEQELLAAAMAAGKAITPELKAEISALAGAYAQAAADAASLNDRQDKIRQSADDFAATSKDFAAGFISDLRQGKSLTEALSGALDKLIDKLIDSALDGVFDTSGNGGSLFGSLLAGIGSLFGFADGGLTGDNHNFTGKIEDIA